MGFANSVVPAWAVPKITLDPTGYYMMKENPVDLKCGYDLCNLCYPEKSAAKKKNTAKEIDVTVKLTAQTAVFKEAAAAKANNNEATIEVNYYPYVGDKTVATLNLTVPNAYGDDTYANVRLNGDDLKALQDAIYKVRVEVAKAGIKNADPLDEVYPF